MTFLLATLLVEAGVLARFFLLPPASAAGPRIALLSSLVAAQALTFVVSRRVAHNGEGGRGTLSLLAIAFAIVAGLPDGTGSGRMDLLMAAGFIVLLASLAVDPVIASEARSKPRSEVSTVQDFRLMLLAAVTASALLLSWAGAPMLNAAVQGVRDLPTTIADAVRHFRFGRRSGNAAGSDANNSGRSALADATTTHEVHAGVGDRGSHDVVLYLRPAADEPIALNASRRFYVRTMTYDAFVDGRWTTRSRGQRVLQDQDDLVRDGRIAFYIPSDRSFRYTVCAPPTLSGVLPVLPRVKAIHLPRVVLCPNEIILSPLVARADWLTFEVESAPLHWDDIPAAETTPGNSPGHTWTQNNTLSDRIEAEALRIAPGGRNDPEAVSRIRTHLGAAYTYSIGEQPQPDMTPVEAFLFRTRKGHCDLYATSCALMLQSIGIPCRFSLGYCGGTYDAAKRLYAFHGDEYHAWVEVFLEKHGWVVLDPTPGGATDAPGAPTLGPITDVPPAASTSDLAGMIRRTALSNEPSSLSAGALSLSSAVVRALLCLALLVAGYLVFASVRIARRRVRDSRAAGGRRGTKTGLAFFDAFCRHFARHGTPMRQNETPLEYLARLKRTGLAGDAFDDAIHYVCCVCFGGTPRDRAAEDALLRVVHENCRS